MAHDGRLPSESLSLTQLQRIESVCARFEEESADSHRPNIDAFLNGVNGVERSELLRELLALDLELRERRGETPNQTDYAHLSTAGDQTVVRSVFDATRIARVRSDAERSRQAAPAIGSQIGSYTLLKCLGEGGMGTVYLAEQHEPISRQVALKVVKSEIGSKKIIERFQQERQALAAMDHPNIAKVLDAGTGADNSPYFVMELVDGLPINQHCDQNKLGVKDRLKLFIQVCLAVQHAHQKGIIHRDLKPSNVMVTNYDGKPVPKVIDFGLATAVRAGLLPNESQTDIETIMGTFQYMSPEQADPRNADVDTRSDVYSLGVILFELLTGETPLPRESLRDASYYEILQHIRQADTPLPSRKLLSDTAVGQASLERRLDDQRLVRIIRGDLDWIAIRALAKNRDERYETAIALAQDVQRFLDNEPVLAGPPSARYRVARFIRRNRGSVAAAAAVTLSLVAGLILATWGLLQARDERDLARTAQGRAEAASRALDGQLRKTRAARDAEAAASESARTEAATTEAVNLFLSNILRSASPRQLGRDATVRAALDRASAQIDTAFPQRPRVKMAILASLATTYLDLGEYSKAEMHGRSAAQLYEEICGPSHQATLESMDNLARILHASKKYDEAEMLMRQIGEITRHKWGPDDRRTLIARNNLATLLAQVNKLDDALAILAEVLESKRKVLGETHESTLSTWSNLSVLQVHRGRKQEAVKSLNEIVDVATSEYGQEHPQTLLALDHLAFAQSFVEVRDVIPTYRKLVDLRTRVLGPEHPDTMRTMWNLSTSLLGAGRPQEAEPVLRSILAWNEEFSSSRGVSFDIAPMLVLALAAQNKGQEAEDLALQVLAERNSKYGENDIRVTAARMDLGYSLVAQGRHDEAEPVLRECYQQLQAAKRDHRELQGIVRVLLGTALAGLERFDQAEPLLLEGHAIVKQIKGRHHVYARQAVTSVKDLYTRWEKPGQLERWEKLVD